jgi:hypothetical protein
MSQSRVLAVSQAPIPSELVYSPSQQEHFALPQSIEQNFRGMYSDNISDEYLDGINTLLKELADACNQATSQTTYYGGEAEVVTIRVKINLSSLQLEAIIVRPCFEGHGMLAIIVYQLVKAAQNKQIPYVQINQCCDKTINVLHYLFRSLLTVIPIANHLPTCRISNLWQISAAYLRLNEKADCTEDAIKLKHVAFPTATQLNNQAYVSAHYHTKYAKRFHSPASMSPQPPMHAVSHEPTHQQFLPEAALRAEYDRLTNEITAIIQSQHVNQELLDIKAQAREQVRKQIRRYY